MQNREFIGSFPEDDAELQYIRRQIQPPEELKRYDEWWGINPNYYIGSDD